jgi:hypothetical protein
MTSILRTESSIGKAISAATSIHARGPVTPECRARSAQNSEVRYSREYHRTLVYFHAQRAERERKRQISERTEPNLG